MSKFVKYFAALAMIAGALAVTPTVASAQRHGGGWHGGGWHGGGWHGGGGWRGGGWRSGGWRGGWGPAVGLGLGFGAPFYGYGGPFYGGPYYGGYYAQNGDCGWVRVRVWRNGHRVLRSVRRC